MSIATEIQRLQTAKVDIKTAIENKGVEVGNGTIDTYAEKINEISVGSSDNFYDTFWDNYQDNGNRDMYYAAFPIQGWNDKNYNPKYIIKCSPTTTNAANDIFRNNDNITDTKMPIDITDCTTRLIFDGCSNLKNIVKLIVSKITTYYRVFRVNCALENVTFEGEIGADISFGESQKLSNASIQNIIDHLADLTGQATQTLTFHKTVGEKLTDTQKATVTAKNWTLAY